jgi:hypothetical protein
MKKLAFVLATATALGVAVPASAQVYFGAGPFEFGVGGYRSWWGGPGAYAYDYEPGYAYGGCRMVKVRRHLPDGTVAIRTRRVC